MQGFIRSSIAIRSIRATNATSFLNERSIISPLVFNPDLSLVACCAADLPRNSPSALPRPRQEGALFVTRVYERVYARTFARDMP